MSDNTALIIAVELACAAQAVDLQTPSDPSPGTRPIYELVRTRAAFLAEDRLQSAEFEALAEAIRAGVVGRMVPLDVFAQT
jgi:histidine ammonia-lyase